MSPRAWQPVETRLVSEFVAVRYPKCPAWFRVRVGTIHGRLDLPGLTDAERRMGGVFRRWADAVVLDRNRLVVIEAAIMASPGKVSQLDLYLRLIPQTPEFREYSTRTLQGVLLCGVVDPVVSRMASERGFTVAEFCPGWLQEYLDQLPARKRVATLSEIPE